MAFVVRALDKPGSLSIRKANREAHLAFLDAASDRLKLAGPLLSDAGDMIGSLLIVEFESSEAVREWLKGDPYSLAGLFRDVSVTGFKPVIARFGDQ